MEVGANANGCLPGCDLTTLYAAAAAASKQLHSLDSTIVMPIVVHTAQMTISVQEGLNGLLAYSLFHGVLLRLNNLHKKCMFACVAVCNWKRTSRYAHGQLASQAAGSG